VFLPLTKGGKADPSLRPFCKIADKNQYQQKKAMFSATDIVQ
jgi:hypothetical protein